MRKYKLLSLLGRYGDIYDCHIRADVSGMTSREIKEYYVALVYEKLAELL